MYNLISRDFLSQHNEIAGLITGAVATEKIYLLGCSLSHIRTESIFAMDAPTARHVSHYFVLVLVNLQEGECCTGIQDKIENVCRSFIPVTAIVLPVERFNEWLKEGHPFACRVYNTAECIHDTGSVFATPKTVDKTELNRIKDAHYNAGINKVQEFLAGADLYRIRKQNKMAAFMLHQAAEQALHTLLKVPTGLHVNTHNIDKLVRYCSMVSYRLPAIFPRNNENNERLFQLLQKAYVDSRYKEDYKISTDELLLLTERVREVEGVLEEVWAS